MSDYLAGRQQFSLKAESTLEAVLTSGQKLQYDSPATLMVSRPNKLRAHRKGDLANQEFFYDGKTLTLYNPRENLYATTAAPATLDETLDFAREKLDILAPAAELLYKNAAEKMLKEASAGFVVGPSIVAGVKCTHLAFRGAEVDWQIWIEDGDKPLPRKFMLTSKQVSGAPQFTVLIRSWDVAPKLKQSGIHFHTAQRRQEDRVSQVDRRHREVEIVGSCGMIVKACSPRMSMSLRSSTEYEIAAPLHAPRFVMPAKAGIQATEGGWIPAFAGMTEALCQFVAQIVLAHVFSKEATKDHEGRKPED